MDDYTKFPNKIIEAMLEQRFTALQMRIIIYIIRKTNGWNKQFDYLAIARIARDIHATRPRVSGAVNDLIKMGVLSVKRETRTGLSEMSVNDPEKWDKDVPQREHATCEDHVPQKEQVDVPRKEQGCAAQGTYTCAAQGTHKRKHKDTITKEKERKGSALSFSQDDDDDEGEDPAEMLRRLQSGNL